MSWGKRAAGAALITAMLGVTGCYPEGHAWQQPWACNASNGIQYSGKVNLVKSGAYGRITGWGVSNLAQPGFRIQLFNNPAVTSIPGAVVGTLTAATPLQSFTSPDYFLADGPVDPKGTRSGQFGVRVQRLAGGTWVDDAPMCVTLVPL